MRVSSRLVVAFTSLLALLLVTQVVSADQGSQQRRGAQLNSSASYQTPFLSSSGSLLDGDRPPNCPPCPEPSCFNCQLPAFTCAQFGECSEYDGLCSCPVGFGGQDCLSPLCGSPADGAKRRPRPEDSKNCECSEGWNGLNCNVCREDRACENVFLGGDRLGENGTCYTGGQTIRKSFQRCDVTNKKITDMLPGRPPQVTFSCDKPDQTCNFQVSTPFALLAHSSDPRFNPSVLDRASRILLLLFGRLHRDVQLERRQQHDPV